MSNNKLILSTLEDIHYSLKLIQNRVKNINSFEDFLDDEIGIEKLDSISMRLVDLATVNETQKLKNSELKLQIERSDKDETIYTRV